MSVKLSFDLNDYFLAAIHYPFFFLNYLKEGNFHKFCTGPPKFQRRPWIHILLSNPLSNLFLYMNAYILVPSSLYNVACRTWPPEPCNSKNHAWHWIWLGSRIPSPKTCRVDRPLFYRIDCSFWEKLPFWKHPLSERLESWIKLAWFPPI